jgi:ssRNA-specific RNase YbeY (16S rRNA maturation enzyme)
MLQRDQFNLNRDKQLNDIARQKKQDEYLDKMYEQYFADADQQELARLLAKYQGKDGATNVMNGLNPLFLNLR